MREASRHFMVDEAKMALTNNALFSHCLPLRRNVKATDEVMDADYCVAIDEAENRLHVQKALMARLLGNDMTFAGVCRLTDKTVVLAFSGGLDTSFCVPWLAEQGFAVTTLFVDTGGVDAEERDYIATRASAAGRDSAHVVMDGVREVWQDVVVPMLWAGQWYQVQYPLLCSDRYLIVRKALELCDDLGTRHIAHGCTGMGNDQVRFDLTVSALGDYEIIAPVREIQEAHRDVRELRKAYLAERGFDVRAKTSTYTINENLLGVDHLRRGDRSLGSAGR